MENKYTACLPILVFLAAAIHWVVLTFVFPGFYNPAEIFHSDFYLPAALARSNIPFQDLLGLPRPAGMVILKLIGGLGIRGAVFFTLTMILVNSVLTAIAFMYFCGRALDKAIYISFCLYIYLILTQPYFFTFAAHDALAPFSYFLLMAGAFGWLRYRHGNESVALTILGCSALSAFLVKETYVVSFVSLIVLLFAHEKDRIALVHVFKPVLVVLGALVFSLLINLHNGSPFTGGAGAASYRIVLSPMSIVREWLSYIKAALNISSVAAISLIVIGLHIQKARRELWSSVTFFLAGLSGLIPNSVLPSHHFVGYSISGSSLIFCPLLLAGSFSNSRHWFFGFRVLLLIIVLSSSILWKKDYENNRWELEQGAIQERLMQGLEFGAKQIRTNKATKVLVSGINFPFDPFAYGQPIKPFSANGPISLDVLVYKKYRENQLGIPASAVPTHLSADMARKKNYDQIWLFRANGNLLKIVNNPRFVDTVDLYPELRQVVQGRFSDFLQNESDGYKFLVCGTTLLTYEDWNDAELCLTRAASLIGSNPYSFYYLGVAQEKNGRLSEAEQSYEKAVSLDDNNQRNPAFSASLQKVRSALDTENQLPRIDHAEKSQLPNL